MWSFRVLTDALCLQPEYSGWAWVISVWVIAIWTLSASGLVFLWAGLSNRSWFAWPHSSLGYLTPAEK